MTPVNQMSWWERLKAPTPKFFKKVTYAGGFLVAMTTPVITTTFAVNEWVTKLAMILNIVGLTMISVSQFAVDPEREK